MELVCQLDMSGARMDLTGNGMERVRPAGASWLTARHVTASVQYLLKANRKSKGAL